MKFTRAIRYCMVLLWVLIPHSHVFGQGASFFDETFDSVTPPALPFNWSDTAGAWSTSASVASSGSGVNNLTISGSQAASVRTPIINLAGMTSGTIAFLARRTSTYPQDSLIVLASTDGGATFSVTLLDRGEALPVADGSYELVSMTVPVELIGQPQVVLLFTALGGTTAGSNIRIDDVQLSGEGDPTFGNSIVGFSTDSSVLDETTGTVDVPLFLDFVNTEALQGLQLEVSWDLLELDLEQVLPGADISDPAAWQLSFNAGDSLVSIVLLGDELNALSEGTYDPLMNLRFAVNGSTTGTEAVLTMTNVLGALAVPTGDDAGLVQGPSSHTITLATGDATFEPDLTLLDIGLTPVDSLSEAVLTVSNTGTADLIVSGVTRSNTLFGVAPDNAIIAPGASQQFIVSFSPTVTEFGDQQATLTFLHNGAGGSTDVQASGIGTGGRGDASADGAVDVLDLILGIDFVLAVEVPSLAETASIDVFPFGASDGGLDVRDLTVVSQAILVGSWPDGVSLPTGSSAGSFGPSRDLAHTEDVDEGMGVRLQARKSEGGHTLFLQNDRALRGIQAVLSIDNLSEFPIVAEGRDPEMSTQVHYDEWSGEVRILAVRMDGGALEPGSYPLIEWASFNQDQVLDMSFGLAIGSERERLAVELVAADDTGLGEENEGLPELVVGSPFPNPFVRSPAGELSIPLSLRIDQHLQVQVFDLLGRHVLTLADQLLRAGQQRIVWTGLDQHSQEVAPGLYLVRVSSLEGNVTQAVIIR